MAEQLGGRTPVIAVGLAVVAVITVAIAVIVTATRGESEPAHVAPPPIAERGPLKHRVQATDVIKMDRDTLSPTTHANGTLGVKVTDVELRTTLALEPTDVITAISGRPIKRQFDVYDALLGASMMNATALYVELIRDDKPVLVHWELDGDLRAARSGSRKSRGGGLFPSSPAFPSPSSPVAPVIDPLIDTIKKIDDFTYEVPAATLDALLANPTALGRAARIVPAMKLGQPVGLKIYAIRPQTLFAAIGLKSGDTLLAINDHPLDDANAMMALTGTLKGVSSLRIELERRGRPEVVKIAVTR